jgi:hypothetical protein
MGISEVEQLQKRVKQLERQVNTWFGLFEEQYQLVENLCDGTITLDQVKRARGLVAAICNVVDELPPIEDEDE